MRPVNHFKTKNIKIAVVDDEEVMRRLVSDVLRGEGYEIFSYSDPTKALKEAKNYKFDLILTDIKMPLLDGVQLIKEVHRFDPDVGAIFMTGYADLASAKEAVKEGAYDYILKPFDLNEVRKSVTQTIEKRLISEKKAKEKGIEPILDLDKKISKTQDRETLLKLTLDFSLTQTQTQKGSVLLWDEETQKVKIFLTSDLYKDQKEEIELAMDSKKVEKWFEQKNIIKTSKLKEHPIFSSLFSLHPELSIWENIIEKDESMISIPVSRDRKIFQMLNLNRSEDQGEIPVVYLKLLSFIAGQTALSIENFLLLERSRSCTLELEQQQEKLIQLDRIATKALQSAEIGHELNNYLTVVVGNLQRLLLILEKDNHQEGKKYVEATSEHLQRMSKFISGLMELKSLKSEKKKNDLNQLIQKTLSFIKTQNRFKNISFETNLNSKIPPILLDSGQIQQLLYNLLNNSADAMGKRKGEGGVIKIETFYHPDINLAEMKISDTGKGMSQEELSKVFKTRFTTKESGHGFGLIACKRIVNNHQGKIEVESQPNQGTAFRIKLPIRTDS